jgi:hypothetical protein
MPKAPKSGLGGGAIFVSVTAPFHRRRANSWTLTGSRLFVSDDHDAHTHRIAPSGRWCL